MRLKLGKSFAEEVVGKRVAGFERGWGSDVVQL
jgi:hypothetical protein